MESCRSPPPPPLPKTRKADKQRSGAISPRNIQRPKILSLLALIQIYSWCRRGRSGTEAARWTPACQAGAEAVKTVAVPALAKMNASLALPADLSGQQQQQQQVLSS